MSKTEKASVTPAQKFKNENKVKQIKVEVRNDQEVITHDGLIFKLINCVSGKILVSSRSGRATFDKILKDNKL